MSTAVLICDDSSVARKQMARALSMDRDMELSFATNGIEALDAVRAGKGDILFLDLNMPEMDGYQVLEIIQREELNTIVIVVSGDIQPDAQKRVMKLGALAFIRKPVESDEMAEVLARYGLLTDKSVGKATSFEEQPGLRDCYREVANISMGQSADLLARFLDVFVVLPTPNVNILEPSELHMALAQTVGKDTISAVSQGFAGAGIAGEALLLFHDSSFSDFARLMHYEGSVDRSVERELLIDVSGILIGAFLLGIADQLDVSFSEGHPVVLGQHVDIENLLTDDMTHWQRTLAIEISYTIENFEISFDLLLLFTEDSIKTIDKKLGYLLD